MNKIKNNVVKKSNKIGIFCLSMLLLLSSTSVLASSHNVTQEFYNEYTAVTGNGGVYGSYASLRIDGQVAWCLQANRVAQPGINSVIDFADIGINDDQRDNLSLIANFGYHVSPSRENEVLTQNAVWTYLGWTDWYPTPNYPTRDAFDRWYNDIMLKVNNYKLGVSFEHQTLEINVGQTITLNDTNGVLSDMRIISTDGLQVSINGNQLSVTGTVEANDESQINLIKQVSNEGTNFVVRSGDSQALSVLRTRDPKISWLRFKVNKYVDVNLSKVDSENNTFTPQGDASLNGAEYTLYNSNNQAIETKRFDNSGIVRFEKLWANDTYYIKETKAPIGYLLSDEVFHINPTQLLSSGAVGTDLQLHLTAKEDVMKQGFQIIKVSSDGSSQEIPTLEGEEFTVKLQSEIDKVGWDNAKTYDTITTDKKGFAESVRLPYGTYLVRQTYTLPNVQTTRDFTVVIDQDSDTPQFYRILNNAPFKAYIQLIKQDEETNENVVFDSAEFQIHDSDGNVISQKVGDKQIDTFTTDETGTITTPLMLGGGTYFIHEVKTPNGYLTLDEPLEFVVTNQGAVEIDEDGDPILRIVIQNEKPTGKVIIQKTFEEFKNVEDNEIDDIEPLEDINVIEDVETEIKEMELFAKFKVIVAEDITNPMNGEILYAKGDVISNLESEDGFFHTNENKQVIIDNLPLGTGQSFFEIHEVDATENYVLVEPILVTFTQEDDTTKEYVIELEVENKLTETIVSKVDALTKEALADAKLEIRTLDREAPYILNGTELSHTTTSEYWTIKGLPRDTQMMLHELEAPTGYHLANDILFTGGQNEIVIMEDEPILTKIQVNKVDVDRNAITGSEFVFGLFADEDATVLITTANADVEKGTATFTDLRYGTYYVKELEAPNGYELSDEIVQIIVNETLENVGQTYSFEYVNVIVKEPTETIETFEPVETGDNTKTVIYTVFALLSLSSAVCTLINNKRKKEKEDK